MSDMSRYERSIGLKVNISAIANTILAAAIMGGSAAIWNGFDKLASKIEAGNITQAQQTARIEALTARFDAGDRRAEQFQKELQDLAVWCGRNPRTRP